MTEVQENVADTAEATEPAKPVFVDDMQELFFDKLVGFIKERNTLVAQANAANGDRESITEDITENSEDPQIVAARTARDEAVARLEQLVTPLVESKIANAGEGLGNLQEKLAEVDGKVKPGFSYYKKMYGEKAAELLPAQTRLKGVRISNAGTGGKRIRGFNVIITANGETDEFDNFASAAKSIGKETAELQNAFFTAAGTKELKEVADRVGFTVTFTETDEEGTSEEVTASVVAYREDKVDGASVLADVQNGNGVPEADPEVVDEAPEPYDESE